MSLGHVQDCGISEKRTRREKNLGDTYREFSSLSRFIIKKRSENIHMKEIYGIMRRPGKV